MEKVRIGIIGAGGIVAKLHLPSLVEENNRCEVRLIAGRKESRLRVLQDRFGISNFTTRYEDVIEDPEIDAVLVATPHSLHVPWAIKAIEAGKHVLIEKPLAETMEAANSLVDSAEKGAGIVMCLPHYSPIVHTIRRMILDGKIGAVSSARCRISHGGPEVYYREISSLFDEAEIEEPWFFDAKQTSVGALFDMGVYAVSSLVATLGSVVEVTAFTSTVAKPTDLDDTAAVLLRLQNGAIAVAETGWCDPARSWSFSVTGTGANITAVDRGKIREIRRPTALDRDNAPIDCQSFELTENPGEIHAHFLDAIASGKHPPLANAWTARHTTEILLAAMASAESGKTVAIQSRAFRES